MRWIFGASLFLRPPYMHECRAPEGWSIHTFFLAIYILALFLLFSLSCRRIMSRYLKLTVTIIFLLSCISRRSDNKSRFRNLFIKSLVSCFSHFKHLAKLLVNNIPSQSVNIFFSRRKYFCCYFATPTSFPAFKYLRLENWVFYGSFIVLDDILAVENAVSLCNVRSWRNCHNQKILHLNLPPQQITPKHPS